MFLLFSSYTGLAQSFGPKNSQNLHPEFRSLHSLECKRRPEQEQSLPGTTSPAESVMGMYVLDEGNFHSHIADRDTFVRFSAPWCIHSKVLAGRHQDGKKVLPN